MQIYCCFCTAPDALAAPNVEAFNATSMEISWDPPALPNGPTLEYTVRQTVVSFNHPPPTVDRGRRFHGGGYYKFPPETLPQGVGFTGKVKIKIKKIFSRYFSLSYLSTASTQHDILFFFSQGLVCGLRHSIPMVYYCLLALMVWKSMLLYN